MPCFVYMTAYVYLCNCSAVCVNQPAIDVNIAIVIVIAQRGRTGVLPSQLLDRHLLVSSQLVDLLLHRCRVISSFTLLRRDRGLIILLTVAVEVAVTTLVTDNSSKVNQKCTENCDILAQYNCTHTRTCHVSCT